MARSKQFVDALVWRMNQMGVPKAMVLLTLLVIWTEPGTLARSGLQEPAPLQWMEFFAGKAEATRMFHESHYRTAKLDIEYMQPKPNEMNPMDLLSDAGMGLAISTVLLGDHINGFVSHFGLKCSSFSPVNAGTSGRTPCTPYGNFHYTSVLEGNCLASRVVLLLALVVCLNGTFILEQPGNSMFEYYQRFRDFTQKLMEIGGRHTVQRVGWWMAMYGGPTPKRHVAYSNSPAISRINLGRLEGWDQKMKAQEAAGAPRVQTCIQYFDKKNQRRYKGAPALKASENYPADFGKKLVMIYEDLITQKSGLPALPKDLPCAKETFASMSYDDLWQEADLVSVCHWLKGGRDVSIPKDWKDLLPKKL